MLFWALGMDKKENRIIVSSMHQAIEELRSIRFHNLEAFFLCLLLNCCSKFDQIIVDAYGSRV